MYWISFSKLVYSVRGIKLQIEQEQRESIEWWGWIVIYISEPVKGSKPKWNCHYCLPLGFIALLFELAPYESKTIMWICKASPLDFQAREGGGCRRSRGKHCTAPA